MSNNLGAVLMDAMDNTVEALYEIQDQSSNLIIDYTELGNRLYILIKVARKIREEIKNEQTSKDWK